MNDTIDRNTPSAELTALIRKYASQGEPGIALLASLVDAFKRGAVATSTHRTCQQPG